MTTYEELLEGLKKAERMQDRTLHQMQVGNLLQQVQEDLAGISLFNREMVGELVAAKFTDSGLFKDLIISTHAAYPHDDVPQLGSVVVGKGQNSYRVTVLWVRGELVIFVYVNNTTADDDGEPANTFL